MKFEKPIMKISMFELESVMTNGSTPTVPETKSAEAAAALYLTDVKESVRFTF